MTYVNQKYWISRFKHACMNGDPKGCWSRALAHDIKSKQRDGLAEEFRKLHHVDVGGKER